MKRALFVKLCLLLLVMVSPVGQPSRVYAVAIGEVEQLLGYTIDVLAPIVIPTFAGITRDIQNVQVGTQALDVHFHAGRSLTEVFGEFDIDSGTFADQTPMFWGDQDGAQAAAEAVLNALGTTRRTAAGRDDFLVPYDQSSTFLHQNDYFVAAFYDSNNELAQDELFHETDWMVITGWVIATFIDPDAVTVATRINPDFSPDEQDPPPDPVPEPATILLLGTGLLGAAGFRKKFNKG